MRCLNNNFSLTKGIQFFPSRLATADRQNFCVCDEKHTKFRACICHTHLKPPAISLFVSSQSDMVYNSIEFTFPVRTKSIKNQYLILFKMHVARTLTAHATPKSFCSLAVQERHYILCCSVNKS
jgi:hypothetical protein